MRPLIAVLCLSAAAQQQVFTEAPVYVTAIELVADVRDRQGKVPTNLKVEDFTVLEDGIERRIIGVDYTRGSNSSPAKAQPEVASTATEQPNRTEWQVVIYFDLFLSGATTIRSSAHTLMKRAEELASLGPVDIVIAEPKPTLLLSDSRDVEAIRRAMKSAAVSSAQDFLMRYRRLVREEQDHSWRPGWLKAQLSEERTAIRHFRVALLEWLSRYPRRVPRALLLVSDGFDLDCSDFYSRFFAREADVATLRSECDFGGDVEALGRSIASAGWTTIGVRSGFGGASEWANDASRSSIGSDARNPLREKPFFSIRTDAPLRLIGEATGGWSGLTSKLPGALSSLGERVIITYQVSRPPDGKVHQVEVRARRPDVTVRTFGWSADALPEDVATARAIGLLRKDRQPAGTMPLSLDLRWKDAKGSHRSGQLTLQAPLDSLKPLLGNRKPVFRVTVVVIDNKAGGVFTMNRIVSDYDATLPNFAYRAPMEAPATSFDLAVTVEELTTGIWGGQTVKRID